MFERIKKLFNRSTDYPFHHTRAKIDPERARIVIRIADFAVCPAGLIDRDGPHNAKRFREDVLVPALRNSEVILLVLDGVADYPANWIQHVFGPSNKYGFSRFYVESHLEIVHDNRSVSM